MFNVLTGFKFIGEKNPWIWNTNTFPAMLGFEKLQLPDQTIRTWQGAIKPFLSFAEIFLTTDFTWYDFGRW